MPQLEDKVLESFQKTDSILKTAAELNITDKAVKNHIFRLRKKGKLPPVEKSTFNSHEALERECIANGLPSEMVSNYWYKGKHFSIHLKGQQKSIDDIADLIIGEMKKHSPKTYKPIKADKGSENLVVINPADVHIGKLCSAWETGDGYDHNIARERVLKGVTSLIQKSKLFGVEKFVTVIGNDILHTDNAKSTTTSGTFQDTNIMWYDAFTFAFKLYIEVIEQLLTVAPVHIAYNPSNHDYVSGFMLAQSVQAWFNRHPSVTFDVSPAHRKYVSYGANLIGLTRGDGAKDTDLPMLMAHESKDWNNCKHRYIYTNHIHHKKSKDFMSVCVESFRSPSGTDSWHHRNGFQHAPKAVEAFIHHKQFGQIARLTEIF
jgi:hypothetical protein